MSPLLRMFGLFFLGGGGLILDWGAFLFDFFAGELGGNILNIDGTAVGFNLRPFLSSS